MKKLFLAALVAALCAWAPAYAQSEKPVVIKGGHQQVLPAGDTLDLSVSPLNTNITGSTQCVQANSAGVISGTGVACGTGSGSGTVTSVTCGTGLSGGVITTSGTCSITAPVTVALGGTNATSASGTALDNISGFASTGFLTRTGAGAYSFQSATNGITLGNLAQSAANTVLGNATASLANVTALSLTDCHGASNAVIYTAGTGFGCNTISSGSGTVTHTAGALTSGQLIFGNGLADIKVGDLSGDVSTSGSGVTAIGALKVATGMLQGSAVTLAKIANAAANTRFVGSGSAGSGAAYAEQTISAGTGISITVGASGITINNVGAGSVGSEVLVSEVVTAGSQATVTFSAIPATWRDLRLVVRGRGDTAANQANVLVQVNTDTGANYDSFFQQTNKAGGAGIETLGGTNVQIGYISAATATASEASSSEAIFPDYRGTTFQKMILSNGGLKVSQTTGGQYVVSGTHSWRNTAAITEVKVLLGAGNFVNNSVVSLYARY